MGSRTRLWQVVVALLVPVSCGGDDEPPAAPAIRCRQGDTRQCMGPGRCVGGQQCLPDGSGFGTCDCGIGGTGGASGSGGQIGGAGDGGSLGSLGSGGVSGAGAVGGSAGTGGSSGAGAVGGSVGTGGSSGTGTAGPCGAVPPEGVCLGTDKVQWCSVPTGRGEPSVVTQDCKANEQCAVTGGIARCNLVPGGCIPDTSECSSGSTLRVCDATGAWLSQTCSDLCRDTALGAFCVPSFTMNSYTLNLGYEYLRPNISRTDWDPTPQTAPARGVLILSTRGQTLLDAVTTDASGSFTIKIPSSLQSDDAVYAFLTRATPGGASLAYAVAEPAVGDGLNYVGDRIPAATSLIWGWSIDPSVTAPGSSVVITRDLGSGVMRVFDQLGAAYEQLPRYFAGAAKPLVVWLRYNTEWDCGACFLDSPAASESFQFDAQIFLSATFDESYWADAVTTHELGHWVMATFGTSPREGGRHCLGSPTFPGQAWSEGFATGYSALMRADSYYHDKQEGTFFWIDLAARSYSSSLALPFSRANPGLGIMQQMDENEISAMLWELGRDASIGTKVLSVLASQRLNRRPFARGYTRHTWDIPTGCTPKTDVVDTGQSAPMFSDYLDALRCSGVPASSIDTVTDPSVSYPYPSASPLCP
jgi:hypothetical protein